jgi:hypothetical protein
VKRSYVKLGNDWMHAGALSETGRDASLGLRGEAADAPL